MKPKQHIQEIEHLFHLSINISANDGIDIWIDRCATLALSSRVEKTWICGLHAINNCYIKWNVLRMTLTWTRPSPFSRFQQESTRRCWNPPKTSNWQSNVRPPCRRTPCTKPDSGSRKFPWLNRKQFRRPPNKSVLEWVLVWEWIGTGWGLSLEKCDRMFQ